MKAAPSHLWQVDILRAVAILMVFGYHLLLASYGTPDLYTTPPGGHWNIIPRFPGPTLWIFYPLSFGQAGVVLFFVLSGFCIHHSTFLAGRSARAKGLSPPAFSYPRFLWRRAWRILPAYYVALVGFFLLRRIVEHVPGERWSHGLTDFAWHALMIHNLKPATFLSINPAFWSLAVEWQFYLIYPAFLVLERRAGLPRTLWLAALLSIALQVMVSLKAWPNEQALIAWSQFPLITWFNWCLGAAVAARFDRGKRLFSIPTPLVPVMWCVLLLFAGYDQTNDLVAGAVGMAWPLMFAITLEVYLHMLRPPTRLDRALLPIGLCSYSLYLLHQPLLAPLLDAAHHWLHLPAAHWMDLTGTAAIVLGLLTVIAWLSYRAIETPAHRAGARFALPRPIASKASATVVAVEHGAA